MSSLYVNVVPTRERQVAVVEEQTRPSTAKVANVILDNDDDNEDDGEEFLIEEAPKDPLLSLEPDPEVEVMNVRKIHSNICSNEKVAAVESGGQEHGALVQQILETQKELQDGNKRERVEIEREAAVRFIFLLFLFLTTFENLLLLLLLLLSLTTCVTRWGRGVERGTGRRHRGRWTTFYCYCY